MSLLEFKGPVEGWTVNYIKRHGWKVAATQTHDDLLQEAYIVYMRVCERYPDIETPQHMMALYKTSWTRHFTDLANADTEERAVMTTVLVRNEDGEEIPFDPMGDRDNDGQLAIMLRQAPAEVAAVLNLFLNAPQEILELALSSWNGQDRRCKAGGSAKINRMLGLPIGFDTLKAVHDYFH